MMLYASLLRSNVFCIYTHRLLDSQSFIPHCLATQLKVMLYIIQQWTRIELEQYIIQMSVLILNVTTLSNALYQSTIHAYGIQLTDALNREQD